MGARAGAGLGAGGLLFCFVVLGIIFSAANPAILPRNDASDEVRRNCQFFPPPPEEGTKSVTRSPPISATLLGTTTTDGSAPRIRLIGFCVFHSSACHCTTIDTTAGDDYRSVLQQLQRNVLVHRHLANERVSAAWAPPACRSERRVAPN